MGALPIATTAPASRSLQSETAAADRVVPHCVARWPARGSSSRQQTSLSAGSRLRVIPAASICVSVKITASSLERRSSGGHQPWMEGKIIDKIDIAAGVDHPDCERAHVLGQPAEIGLRSNGRERPPIDLFRRRHVVVASRRCGYHRHLSSQ